jgi:hypothetical protein
MNRLTICVMLALALALSPAMFGQTADQNQQNKQGEAERQAGQTMTGCLNEEGGAFSLKTDAGENVTVTGSADLSKHKGHTVKLTGKVSEEGTKKTMSVSRIEHVSASCTK